MPHLEINGARLFYDEAGSGPETIVFAHGLLWSGLMFGPQVAALKARYRVITFDFRGQGQSEVTPAGYDMDSLSLDAAALIEKLGAGPCHFAGLSMGGFIGLRLASRRPELLRSLILLETTADPEPQENIGKYRRLNFVARWLSLALVAGPVLKIMFGTKFLTDPNRVAFRDECRKRMVRNHRIGISRAVNGVIDRAGIAAELDRIHVPTLIVVGDQDVATVPAKSQRMQEQISGSKLVIIPGAGHSSTLEEPEAVNAAIAAFLAGLSAA